MGYSRSIKVSILRRVLPPNNESITKVSEEMGLNDQTIRNWVKQAAGSQLLIEETSRIDCIQRKRHLDKFAW